MSTETIDPTLNPTDFLDAVIAESEARSPGFGARVEAALEERCRRRAEMNGPALDEPDIKAGDVVYLKSGSPPLTVVDTATFRETHVVVCWFDGNEERMTSLHRDALTKDPSLFRSAAWMPQL